MSQTFTTTISNRSDLHTPDWLRSFKGCEHYSDEEAHHVLLTLDILAQSFLHSGNKLYEEEKPTLTIPMTDTNQRLAA